MNIFVVDNDPKIAAYMLCDKHVGGKMQCESAQMLCTTYHLQGHSAQYKPTHDNHPSNIWIRESSANYNWLIDHSLEMCKEYTRRYNKIHKSQQIIEWCNNNKHLLTFPKSELTPFRTAIGLDKKCRTVPNFDLLSVVEQYRLFYVFDKPFAKWKTGNTPDWFIQLKQQYINNAKQY